MQRTVELVNECNGLALNFVFNSKQILGKAKFKETDVDFV